MIHSCVMMWFVHLVHVQELKSRNEVILETKARLEDEVESLQSKATMMGQHCLYA